MGRDSEEEGSLSQSVSHRQPRGGRESGSVPGFWPEPWRVTAALSVRRWAREERVCWLQPFLKPTAFAQKGRGQQVTKAVELGCVCGGQCPAGRGGARALVCGRAPGWLAQAHSPGSQMPCWAGRAGHGAWGRRLGEAVQLVLLGKEAGEHQWLAEVVWAPK